MSVCSCLVPYAVGPFKKRYHRCLCCFCISLARFFLGQDPFFMSIPCLTATTLTFNPITTQPSKLLQLSPFPSCSRGQPPGRAPNTAQQSGQAHFAKQYLIATETYSEGTEGNY